MRRQPPPGTGCFWFSATSWMNMCLQAAAWLGATHLSPGRGLALLRGPLKTKNGQLRANFSARGKAGVF